MASDARLRIVIDALNMASGELRQLQGDLDKTGKSAKSGKMSLTELKSGVDLVMMGFKQAADAAKMAYNFFKGGAELDFARDKFDRLSKSIGTTSDMLLFDLRKATKGLVADSELAGSAADFMALGLAKSHDEVVRLTRVAGSLGMDMNQLVLTLTNKTTMRFDALGVSVDGFDAKVAKLKATGMDANAAFTEAFLQQAEDQIARVGEKIDSATAGFARFEAELKNFTDSVKRDSGPAMGDMIGGMADYMAANRLATQAVKDGLISTEEANHLWAEAVFTGKTFAEVLAELTAKTDAHTLALDAQRQRGKELVEQMERRKKVSQETAAAVTEQVVAEQDLKQALDDLKTLIAGPVGAEFDNFEQAQENLKEKSEELRAKIAELSAQEFLSDDQQADLQQFRDELAENNAAIRENADAHDEATKRILFNILEQRLAIDGFTEEEMAFLEQLATKWGMLDSTTAAALKGVDKSLAEFKEGDIRGAIEVVDELVHKLNLIPRKINVSVLVAVNQGMDEALANIKGGGIYGNPKPPGRAMGGPVQAGVPYLVGERGPEYFVPTQSGTIVPNQTINNWNISASYANQPFYQVADTVRFLAMAMG